MNWLIVPSIGGLIDSSLIDNYSSLSCEQTGEEPLFPRDSYRSVIRSVAMQVYIAKQTVPNLACDALIVGAVSTKEGNKSIVSLTKTGNAVDQLLNKLITERSADGEFKAGLGEILTI